MRSLSLLAVCLFVPGLAFGETSEQMLAALEKRLTEGALRATVTGETQSPTQKGSFKSELTLQAENVLVRIESVTGLHFRVRVVSDGRKVMAQAWTGKPLRNTGDMTGARVFWAKMATRLGLGGSFAFSSKAIVEVPHPDADAKFKVTSSRVEQVEGAPVLHMEVDVGAPSRCKVTLHLDPETKLPNRRRVELALGDRDTYVITETYEWEEDPKLAADLFRVAMEMPSDKDLAEQKRQADAQLARLRERQVQLSLRQISLAQILHQDTKRVFAADLQDLKLVEALRKGEQHGYTFKLCTGSQAPGYYWMAVASPTKAGAGDCFAINQKGDIFRRKEPIPLDEKICRIPKDAKRVR